MVCHCKPPVDGSVGCGSQCLNRMLNIECVQGTCPCGDVCSNQQVMCLFACRAAFFFFTVIACLLWAYLEASISYCSFKSANT